jgi:outer membrane protein, heavy metal efflux system
MPVDTRVDRRRTMAGPCIALTLSAMAAVPGCTARQVPVAAVAARPLGQGIPVYQPTLTEVGRPDGPGFESPVGTIALRDAVALALLHSPDLAAFAWETRAREARILQSGRPPNPTVNVLSEDLGASRFLQGLSGLRVIQPQTTVQLSQLIELGGKRTARESLAARNRDLAAWDYETARIDVLTQVTRTFIDVLAAQQRVALTEQTMQLAVQVEESVGARVIAGVVSPIEQTRAAVALASARLDAARAGRQLDASRQRLAATWGSTDPRFASVTGDLTAIPDLPPIVQLASRVADNPDLARWAAEISQREAAVVVERSKGVPDVTLTGGYRRFTDVGSNAAVIGGSLSLPVFDRNRDGVEEASRRLAKAYEERRAAAARVSRALAVAYRDLSSAHDEITALRSAVLPGAQQTFEALTEGYRAGKFGYLEVLDAQRTLVGAGGQYVRALADYHTAAANVERLIGAPLSGSTERPPTTEGAQGQ